MSLLLLEGGGVLLLQGGGGLILSEVVAAASTAPLLFKIDWNVDDLFTGTGEDVSDWVDGSVGAMWSRGRDQVRQFAPAAAGQAAFALNNISRDYSPGNASSPIAGLVLPGRKVQIETQGTDGEGLDFVDGTDFEFIDSTSFDTEGTPGRVIWSGLIDDILQHPENRSVGFPCLGNLSKLRGKTVSTALYQNITTSDAISAVLDAAGWPPLARTIQTGLTTLSWWWLDNQDAFDAIEQLRATEGPWASVYEDALGNFVFENRDARMTQTRSTTPQATFTGTGEITSLVYNPNFKDTVDAAVITINERAMQGQTEVWSLGETLTLTPLQVRRIQIRASDPFMSLLTPSPVPNNTVQTLTADVPLTAGTFKPRFREATAAAAIDWDSTATEIQTSLESISTIGAGNVSCEGGPISTTPVSVQFIGIFAGINILDLIEITESTLNPVSAPASIEVVPVVDGNGLLSEKQSLVPSSPLTGGGPYSVTVDLTPAGGGIGTASGIAYNANAATVQTALRTISGMGSCLVTGGPMDSGLPFNVNLIYSENLDLMTIGGTAVTGSVPTTSISVAITTQGGVPDYVITAGAIDFVLSRVSGQSAMLTCTAGALGGTATGLRVRGNPVTVVRTQQASFPEDTTDIPSGKIFQPNIRQEISLTFAQEYVEMFVEHYSVPRPTVTFQTITSIYSANNDSLYAREISDLITIVEAQTGLSETYHIERIQQSIQGLTLVTEFGCEQALAPGFGDPIVWY